MSTSSFSDYIFVYPEVGTPHFSTQISEMKEFNELGAKPNEPKPERGELFNHQKLIERYMRYYDRIFLYFQTGQGKTCTFVSVAEYWKKQHAHIDGVIVLEKGPSTINNVVNQLVNDCTLKGEYSVQDEENKSHISMQREINKKIGNWYDIVGYKEFAKPFTKKSKEDIAYIAETSFSNKLFILDEVHTIHQLDEGDEPSDDGNSKPKSGKAKEKKISTYEVIKTILHHAKRSKIILASATPMINHPREIVSIMNLLLPPDQQIPDDFDIENASVHDVRPYFEGYISYVRETKSNVKVEYQGKGMKDEPEYVVHPTGMIGIQAKTYKRLQLEEGYGASGYYSTLRQASNIVFPDGSYGGTFDSEDTDLKRGITKYVRKLEGNYSIRPEYADLFRGDQLEQLSCKYYEIISLVNEARGNCFCYCHFKYGGGAVMLAACFGANGFEPFDHSTSVYTTKNGKKQLIDTMDKRTRYGLITSETTTAELRTMLELFNSYENRNGEYIKVIIGSHVTRDGINLFNVVQAHLVDAGWHQSGMHQAMSRFTRLLAHDMISNDKIQRIMKEENISYEEAKLHPRAQIKIKAYRHCAMYMGKGLEFPSVDLTLYEKSLKKQKGIRKVETFMKQLAIDCYIHQKRNIPDDDTDPDYYVCQFPKPKQINTETYDIFYSQERVKECRPFLIDKLQRHNTVTIQQMMEWAYEEDRLADWSEQLIKETMQDLSSSRLCVPNKWGQMCYTHVNGNYATLLRQYPVDDNMNRSFYGNHIMATSTKTLKEYVDKHMRHHQGTLFDTFVSAYVPKKTIESQFATLKYTAEQKQSIFEQAAIVIQNDELKLESYEAKTMKVARKVVMYFVNVVDMLHEPVEQIAEYNRDQQQGLIDADDEKMAFDRSAQRRLRKEKTQPHVLISMIRLLETVGKKVRYIITNSFFKASIPFRILRLDKRPLVWEDCSDAENAVYGRHMRYKISKEIEHLEDQKCYGHVLQDLSFRVRDVTGENKREANTKQAADSDEEKEDKKKGKKEKKTDTRSIKRGQKWDTLTIKDVHLLFAAEEILPDPEFIPKKIVYTREKAIRYFTMEVKTTYATKAELELKSDAYLKSLYYWAYTHDEKNKTISQVELQRLIVSYLKEHDRVYYLFDPTV